MTASLYQRSSTARMRPALPRRSGNERVEPAAMLVGVEPVQRVGRQRVLGEAPVTPEIDDRGHRAVDGVLDGDRARVAGVAVDVVGERDEPAVAVATAGLDDPREVALLDPQLGCAGKLAEQERDGAVTSELLPLA